ncbi:MAG TPA: HAD-IA family hydrolase [Actinomycetota bacterium]|nr:HAD-IA family hydrolase [Actinomycetota bacterium]
MTIEVVFFDAGGTILDPYPSFPELFAATCVARGIDMDADRVREVQERVAPHLVELLDEAGLDHGPTLSPEASRAFWTFTYTRFLAELNIDDPAMAQALYEKFSDPTSYRLYDDVRPTFDALAGAGYRLGLISNFDSWLEKMLVEMEVGHVFDTAVISGVEGVEKPDPALYELALERARVDGSRAVHVGDSPVMDIEPASKVGMTPVLLDRIGRYSDDGVRRITKLDELVAVVDSV